MTIKLCLDSQLFWINEAFNILITFSKDGDERVVDREQIVSYVLHVELRNKFPRLWTFEDEDRGFYVKIVTSKERKLLESGNSETEMEDKLVSSMLGFSKLMKYISKSRKPLIGHNCLLDLIKIYHQFFSLLPLQYKEFKTHIHELFPVIFDTKNICFKTKKEISKVHPELEHVFASSNLNELHHLLGISFSYLFILIVIGWFNFYLNVQCLETRNTT